MSNIALYRRFHSAPVRGSRCGAVPAQKDGLLRRIFQAINRYGQSRVEEEARRFIAAHGGRLTDDVERQLNERLSGGGRGFTP